MKKIYLFALSLLSLVSCGDFDEINTNPDTPTVVTPSFLATQIILKTTESTTGKWFIADSWLVKQTTFTEHLEWYLYNKFERTDFDDYSILTDADKMREIADANESMKEAEKKAYEGLNLFVRSYALYGMTMAMGDIPSSNIKYIDNQLVTVIKIQMICKCKYKTI